VISKYIKNNDLETIKADWQGTPIDENGRFINHEFPFKHDFFKLLKWQLGRNPQAVEKKLDTEKIEVLNPESFLNSEKDGILWLGHASFFIRLNGKNILIDPVFGNPNFLKRFVNVPSPINILPKIDYILISHDHRDHADKQTIQQLTKKFPTAEVLVGLNMDELLQSWITSTNRVQTAGWFQKYKTENDISISFVPVRHWSRRTLTDTNKRLWGGFIIQNNSTTIFFGGDTGFGGHFKELAKVFPNIDYFIVGIGAYSPDFVMQEIHQNPEEAIQSFLDAKAKYLIPMHFGTFDLTNEPPNEPLTRLKKQAESLNLTERIKVLKINESLVF
jgi:L-ascorbate metabolism protein UlaG (beta-lactamase superfamily)